MFKNKYFKKFLYYLRITLISLLNYRPRLFWEIWAIDFKDNVEQLKLHQWNLVAINKIIEAAPESVLEVGCGFGRNLRELLRRGLAAKDLHGIDISKIMIRQAKEYVSDSSVDLKFGQADALPFGDNSVNVVYLSLVLMHVPEDRVEKCIAEAVRVSNKLVVILDEYRPLTTGVLSCKINDFTVAHNHLSLIQKQGFYHHSFEVYDKWVVITIKKLNKSLHLK